VMNGLDAAKKIKELNPLICVIALSSDEKNKYIDDSGQYHPFDDFLSKNDIDQMKNFPLENYASK
jgi:DNA-binding NarL/FixJ family response regulator